MNSYKIALIKDNFYAYILLLIGIIFAIRIYTLPNPFNNLFINICTLAIIISSTHYLLKSIKNEVTISFWSVSPFYFLFSFLVMFFFLFDSLLNEPIIKTIELFTDNSIILTGLFFLSINILNYYLFKEMDRENVQELKERTRQISSKNFNVCFRGKETVYRIGSYRCYRQGIVIAGKTISYSQLKEFLDSINKSFDEMTKDDFDLLEMYCIN